MGPTHAVVFLLVICFAASQVQFPTYIQKCTLRDLNGPCGLQSAQSSLKFILNGDNSLGIPNLLPYQADEVHFTSLVQVNLTNTKLYGLDTYKFNEFKWIYPVVKINVSFEYLYLEGLYNDFQVCVGHSLYPGVARITLENPELSLKVYTKIRKNEKNSTKYNIYKLIPNIKADKYVMSFKMSEQENVFFEIKGVSIPPVILQAFEKIIEDVHQIIAKPFIAYFSEEDALLQESGHIDSNETPVASRFDSENVEEGSQNNDRLIFTSLVQTEKTTTEYTIDSHVQEDDRIFTTTPKESLAIYNLALDGYSSKNSKNDNIDKNKGQHIQESLGQGLPISQLETALMHFDALQPTQNDNLNANFHENQHKNNKKITNTFLSNFDTIYSDKTLSENEYSDQSKSLDKDKTVYDNIKTVQNENTVKVQDNFNNMPNTETLISSIFTSDENNTDNNQQNNLNNNVNVFLNENVDENKLQNGSQTNVQHHEPTIDNNLNLNLTTNTQVEEKNKDTINLNVNTPVEDNVSKIITFSTENKNLNTADDQTNSNFNINSPIEETVSNINTFSTENKNLNTANDETNSYFDKNLQIEDTVSKINLFSDENKNLNTANDQTNNNFNINLPVDETINKINTFSTENKNLNTANDQTNYNLNINTSVEDRISNVNSFSTENKNLNNGEENYNLNTNLQESFIKHNVFTTLAPEYAQQFINNDKSILTETKAYEHTNFNGGENVYNQPNFYDNKPPLEARFAADRLAVAGFTTANVNTAEIQQNKNFNEQVQEKLHEGHVIAPLVSTNPVDYVRSGQIGLISSIDASQNQKEEGYRYEQGLANAMIGSVASTRQNVHNTQTFIEPRSGFSNGNSAFLNGPAVKYGSDKFTGNRFFNNGNFDIFPATLVKYFTVTGYEHEHEAFGPY